MKKEEISQKRWIIFSVAALALAVLLFAGSYLLVRSRADKISGPVPAQITSRIISEMNYDDLIEVSPTQLSKHYDIADNVIEDSSLYMSKTTDNASELACFQLKDPSKFPALQASITGHLNAKAAGFKSLNPTQYNALKSAAVTQQGKYVLVSVGSNSAADTKLFREIAK